MVSIEQFSAGALKFIEIEMLPALKVSQRWVVGALLGVAQWRIPEIIRELPVKYPLIAALGLFDAAGNIDLDAARGAVKIACQKHGAAEFSVPLIGTFSLSETNFDALYESIMAEAKMK